MFYINTIKKLNEENAALAAKLSELLDVVIERNQSLTEFMETFSEHRIKTAKNSQSLFNMFGTVAEQLKRLTEVQDALVLTHHNRALLDGTLNPKKK